MPFWSRYPKGTYVRRSAEWYAHQRGRCSITGGGINQPVGMVYGLYNGTGPGVYLHLIGITVQSNGEEADLYYGKFYSAPLDQTYVSSEATISPTAPFYSNDPMPYGIGVFGDDPAASFDDAFFVMTQPNPMPFYATEEVAVIAPGDIFGIYSGEGTTNLFVMFDWYWSID